MSTLPTLRWGVIGTGQVSSWFVQDMTRPRPDAKATHLIQAIGSSSLDKGHRFVANFIPGVSPAPTVYDVYSDVYADNDVDIIYLGIPHAFHKQACLEAINAGKHVLCEKAFTLNAREAKEVFEAARAKGVFVMEAMRMRFFPLVHQLLKMVHKDAVIGKVHRVFCDLGLDIDVDSLGQESRLRNPALGAGTLLDICIYSLTWGLLLLNPEGMFDTKIQSFQTLRNGIDTATSVLLFVPQTGAQGILTSTSMSKTPDVFCRIEGTKGYITVQGESASIPSSFTVHQKTTQVDGVECLPPAQTYSFDPVGWGLYWEADAVAVDIAAGRKENKLMPWSESMKVMEMMDQIRKQGGAVFPQDEA